MYLNRKNVFVSDITSRMLMQHHIMVSTRFYLISYVFETGAVFMRVCKCWLQNDPASEGLFQSNG